MSVFKRLEGKQGKVIIKGLGSVVGEVAEWEIYKRDAEGSKAASFKMQVQFSFLVPSLLTDSDYNEGRELHLRLSKNRIIKVLLDDPERMALNGKLLTMEGVTFEWLEA